MHTHPTRSYLLRVLALTLLLLCSAANITSTLRAIDKPFIITIIKLLISFDGGDTVIVLINLLSTGTLVIMTREAPAMSHHPCPSRLSPSPSAPGPAPAPPATAGLAVVVTVVAVAAVAYTRLGGRQKRSTTSCKGPVQSRLRREDDEAGEAGAGSRAAGKCWRTRSRPVPGWGSGVWRFRGEG